MKAVALWILLLPQFLYAASEGGYDCGSYRATGTVTGPRNGRITLVIFGGTMSELTLNLIPLHGNPESFSAGSRLLGLKGKKVTIQGLIRHPIRQQQGTLEFQSAEPTLSQPLLPSQGDGLSLVQKRECLR